MAVWTDISFKNCPRDANRVAHEADSSRDSLAWDGDPPNFVMPFGAAILCKSIKRREATFQEQPSADLRS
jgi:hypothetical protein